MPVVAVLHHLEHPFLGHVEAPLRAAGLTLDQRFARRGDPLPDLADVDAIVTLGGEQSVRDIASYPYLEEEVALLRSAVQRGVPVLGVCLGGQLLAHALGARVRRAPRRNVGWYRLARRPAAEADPLVQALPDPVPALHWNEDVFDLPEGAVELFERPGHGVEGFRAGECAWAVQFHPDADPPALDGWYARGSRWLDEAGVEEAAARAADAEHRAEQERSSAAMFGAFARIVGRR